MPGPGEFEIIDQYFRRRTGDDVLVGIGDDAAVFAAAGPVAVAVDTIVEGSHFPGGHPPAAIGHRALAVNLSDLAAIGAKPRWATLALTLPDSDSDWLDRFTSGFFALAERFDVDLIGGDTTRGHLTVTVQVFGESPERPLLRAGGRVDDIVYVSGSLGDCAAGLAILGRDGQAKTGSAARLVERFSFPEPRLALGLELPRVATAAVDVSDGLVADLDHICRASGLGAVIDVDRVPLSTSLRETVGADQAADLALAGGDDYELCFTAPPGSEAEVAAIAASAGEQVTAIGRLVATDGVEVVRDGVSIPVPAPGYRHF